MAIQAKPEIRFPFPVHRFQELDADMSEELITDLVRNQHAKIGSIQWCAGFYRYESFSGTGEFVAFDGEKIWMRNLGHCSCYGPVDSDGKWQAMTIEETRGHMIENIEFDKDADDSIKFSHEPYALKCLELLSIEAD